MPDRNNSGETLTARRKLACELHALEGKTKAAAYIEAGFAVPRHADPKVARDRLSAEVNTVFSAQICKDYCAELAAERRERFAMSAEELDMRNAYTIRADVRELWDADGNLRPIQDLPEDVAYGIAGFEVIETVGEDGCVTSRVKKVRFASPGDRTAANTLANRVLQRLTDKVELAFSDSTLHEWYAEELARHAGKPITEDVLMAVHAAVAERAKASHGKGSPERPGSEEPRQADT
jgi:hypothetical protein